MKGFKGFASGLDRALYLTALSTALPIALRTATRTAARMATASLVALLAFTVVASANPVTIQMMEFQRMEEAEWQRAVVQRFNAEHPHIQVELIASPGESPLQRAIAMWAAGIPPHISYGDPFNTVSWGLQGMTLDLEPWFARDVATSDLKDFFPGVLDMHTVDGKRYGLPIDLQVQAFFYAEAPFDEAGVAYPDQTWTWDHVAQVSPRLVLNPEGGDTPRRWAMRDPQWLHWWPVVWHHGGEFVDDPKQPTTFTGDSPEVLEALNWFYHMMQEARTMPVLRTLPGTTAQHLVVDRSVAMAIGNSLYQQEAIQYATEVPWNVTSLPSGPAGNTAFANSLGWAVYRDAGDHDAVWEVLRYFSSRDAMELAVEMRGTLVPHIPTTRDVWLAYNDVP